MHKEWRASRDYASVLDRDGVLYLPSGNDLFSRQDWEELEESCSSRELPYEIVRIGDADESVNLEVARFMIDVTEPTVVNSAVSKHVIRVLTGARPMEFLAALIDKPQINLRRAQVNRMHKGSFIGLHLDKDSNPDYLIAVVLQLGQAFTGGNFIVHHPHGSKTTVFPCFRSVTISRCDMPHEVTKVLSGTRTSLVYFVSLHAGPNRRTAVRKDPHENA